MIRKSGLTIIELELGGNLSVENMYENVRELSRGNFPGECMGIVQEGLVWAQCYLVGMV